MVPTPVSFLMMRLKLNAGIPQRYRLPMLAKPLKVVRLGLRSPGHGQIRVRCVPRVF